MPFNIAEFQANIAAGGGLMKKNKFLVNITPPTSILGRSAGGTSLYSVGRTLEFYAESASIPGISLQTSELRRQGVGNLEKAVYGAALTDVDIRFTIDQYTENFKFFQMWMDTIYNYNPSRGTEYEMEYKDSYCTTLTIFVYNEIEPEQPIMILDLYDAFPVSISDIGLDWGGSDIMKLNVRFNFLSWLHAPLKWQHLNDTDLTKFGLVASIFIPVSSKSIILLVLTFALPTKGEIQFQNMSLLWRLIGQMLSCMWLMIPCSAM
jgi:hypothetical protein